MPSSNEVTELLGACSRGDQDAVAKLLPMIYEELRELAERYFRRERRDHTLQPTALVHEAYMRLVGQQEVQWQNRSHFFGVAAMAMRRILVNHAKSRLRVKRGGDHKRVSLEEVVVVSGQTDPELVALDEALTRLAQVDERKARLVELRFFGGLGIEETAEAMSISPATVKREWNLAKTWLYREIAKGDAT